MGNARRPLILVASTCEAGPVGNTEWLASHAAASLPAGTTQTWVRQARAGIPAFVNQRHTVGGCPMPEPGSVMRWSNHGPTDRIWRVRRLRFRVWALFFPTLP